MPANLSAFGGGARAYTPPSIGQVNSASPAGGMNPMQMMALQNILGGGQGQGQQDQNQIIQQQKNPVNMTTPMFKASDYSEIVKRALMGDYGFVSGQ